ncbi:MAG: YIP1 family protein [bacterium]
MNSETMEKQVEVGQELSGFQKVIGVFTSPGKTFASIDLNPTWLLPILLFAIINLVFIFTVRNILIQETLAQQEERMIERGMESEQIEQALSRTEWGIKYFAPVTGVVFPLIILLIVSGIFLFVGNVILGGSATFKKVFSVSAHAWLIFSLGALVALPIVVAKETMQVTFSLATLMSEESSKTFLYQLLAKIDLFAIWWIAVQSIGLAIIYKMKTQKMTTIVVILYGIYAIVASAIGSVFS